MFDVGRGPAWALKHDRVLLSHGHQDHAAGIPYLVSQRGMMGKGPLQVHCPVEIVEALTRILDAWSEIEGFELQYRLHGVRDGDRFAIGNDTEVEAIRTSHRVPSLAYVVYRTTRRLASTWVGRPGDEIRDARARGEEVTEAVKTPVLAVTGDTRIETLLAHESLRTVAVLVHEVTAWDDRRDVEQTREWGHTHVEEMIEVAERFEGQALVLVHRSERHSKRFAEDVVARRFPADVRDRVHVFGG
jgi:ribonuclease Z